MNYSYRKVLEPSTASQISKHCVACLILERLNKGSWGCGSQLATQELWHTVCPTQTVVYSVPTAQLPEQQEHPCHTDDQHCSAASSEKASDSPLLPLCAVKFSPAIPKVSMSLRSNSQ